MCDDNTGGRKEETGGGGQAATTTLEQYSVGADFEGVIVTDRLQW